MKPLTIEQLKAMEVGDWVWISNAEGDLGSYARKCVCFNENEFQYETIETYAAYNYADYGTKWLAYKNKEQAEAIEQCVICHKDISSELPKIDIYGNHYCFECYSNKCEKEVLKEKLKRGTLVELPCKVEIPLTDDGFVYNIARDCENPPRVYRQRWIDYVYACLLGCGDNYFATKSAAKAKLAELKGEK